MAEGDSFVGRVARDITDQWDIPEQANKPIIKGKNWEKTHGSKHKFEFKSKYNFEQAIKSIPEIIKNPDYVFYNEEEKGLEYYKKLEEGTTLVVRTTKKKVLYLATIYPSSSTKLTNRKNKEIEIMEPDIIDKYRYKEPV